MYKVLSAESCSGGETPASIIISQSKSLIKKPLSKKPLHPPSESLLYPVVNKKVEQRFSGLGVTL
jgi:hypothetical protein